jgi:hypothetical protein
MRSDAIIWKMMSTAVLQETCIQPGLGYITMPDLDADAI